MGPGVEHMHLTTAERWEPHQLNAAAYVVWEAHHAHDVPMSHGLLGAGNGLVSVRRRGQVTHKDVSDKAGFHDRTDPGPGYHVAEVRERAMHFNKHHKF